jgi:hypothetical protein
MSYAVDVHSMNDQEEVSNSLPIVGRAAIVRVIVGATL